MKEVAGALDAGVTALDAFSLIELYIGRLIAEVPPLSPAAAQSPSAITLQAMISVAERLLPSRWSDGGGTAAPRT